MSADIEKSTSTDTEQKEKLLSQEEVIVKTPNAPVDSSKLEGSLTTSLLFAVIAATVGSSFQFGYHIGCVNAPGTLITAWFKESHFHLYNTTLTTEGAENMWAISVGIFAIGGMIGGLLSGKLADMIGRKGALLVNNLFAFIAAAFMALSKFTGIYYFIPVGRLIIGFNCGLNSGLVPMYLTEIAPNNLRGTLGSSNQLLVTIAILVSQIFGLPYLLGTYDRWPYIFAFTVVPCIFQLATLTFCPESPKYSLINKGRTEQAEKDLKKLRGREDVTAELDVIKEEAAKVRAQPKVTLFDMFKPYYRWAIFIAVMMMFSQQLSGINATMFYSTRIFQDAGLTGTWPVYATIAMGTINVAQTVVSLWLVDHPKFGRRSLHLAGLTGMFFSSVAIVIALSIAGASTTGNQYASYASIVFVLLFVVSFATGPGSIPWFYVSEIFDSSARGSANSIAVMSNWLANFLVGTFFLPLNNALKQYTFLVFAAFLAFFIFFTWKFVPETKGKTTEQVNAEMKRNK